MGNNAAFTSFEASVLACYNKGVLDRELLDALAEPYRDMDIDRGGMTGDLAKDGLDIDGIILKTYGVKMSPKPSPDNEKDRERWYDLQYTEVSAIEKKWGWG